MRGFLIRVLASAAAIWIAAVIVPGVRLGDADLADQALTVLLVGAIFGVINAVIKPVVAVLTLPLYILTFGLFALVINALLLMLTGALAGGLGLAFEVDGFWQAVLGSIVISIVSLGFGMLRD